MNKEENMSKKSMSEEARMERSDMTRRRFLGLSAVAGFGVAAASLPGCTGSGKSASEAEGSAAAKSWRTPTESITDIAETLEADIVIVGTGNSGAIALTTAIDAKAKVIALQKADVSVAHGLYNGGVDTILQRASDIKPNLSEWRTRWAQNSGNWGSIQHLNQWIKYSGGIINRLFVLFVENPDAGFGPIIIYNEGHNEDYWNEISSTEHILIPPRDVFSNIKSFSDEKHTTKYLETFGLRDVDEWLTQRAISNGATVRYETPAVQLIRGGEPNGTSGRVTGVIAQRKDGKYIQCNASKGVILCAGGYSNDEEMKKEFLPQISSLKSGYSTKGNVGDAHKMATWVGAQMRRVPHTANPHYDPQVYAPDFPGAAYPWLRVNLEGERFSNEDMPYEQIYAQDMRNPEHTHFQVFDDNYPELAESKMGYSLFRFPWTFIPAVPQGVKDGIVYTGNTIAELAKAMGVPSDTLAATVDRYNTLAKNGYDEDFGKQAARLYPIEKAPFYAIKRVPSILDSMSGLMTNTDMQVLDDNDEVIEGLYAAGNCQSPFFGGFVQPMNICGMGSGRAFTTGHVAALRACGIKDRLWPTTDELIAEDPKWLETAKVWQAYTAE